MPELVVLDPRRAAIAAARERPLERVSEPARARRTDPRYGSRRWQRVAKAVLRRDNHACRIVAGCATRATVADHVIPVYPGMPDSQFFAMDNLRAGCKEHNLARGWASKLPAEQPADSTVVTVDYSRRPDGAA